VTTQIFLASTAFGLATVVAALEDGAFEPADRRILVLMCNTEMPEASTAVLEVSGVAELCTRFDQVYDYNEAIEPLHPARWQPRRIEVPLWERYFRRLWSLGDDQLHLVVESIQVNPAQGLCQIFCDAQIDVYADGLMSYGPTRSALPDSIGCRIERLLHLDLVPGLRPVLLSEWAVRPLIISTMSLRSVVKGLISGGAGEEPTRTSEPHRTALVVGQYLAAGGLLTEQEEIELYASMVSRCADAGFSTVIFKPHPSAPPAQLNRLHQTAALREIELVVIGELQLAEAAYERGGIEAVVGCFSTALATASSLYGLPVFRLGTELMLERLAPYQNSNRIPLTIVDAAVPELTTARSAASRMKPCLNELVPAVSYAMQPSMYPDRRAEAMEYLARNPEARARYVKRRRLTRLELPGGLPSKGRRRRLVRRLLTRLIRRMFGSRP
jgi:Alpha-2,8-polysialyltransferase (POLYST)